MMQRILIGEEQMPHREITRDFLTLDNLDAKVATGALVAESSEPIVQEASNAVGYIFGAYVALVVAACFGVKLYRHFRRKE